MKQNVIIAFVAICAFLLGALMPRTSEIQEVSVKTEVEREAITHSNIPSVPVKPPTSDKEKEIEYIYIPAPKADADTVWMHDTVWVKMPRQYYYAETEDVKIWHSGIDSRIDSLVNFRERQVITKTYKEPWRRNSFAIYGETGYCSDFRLSVGATYQYKVSKWLSVSANAGYDLYIKQPYATARLEINMFSW